MIWLVGNKGMLGSEVEGLLRERGMRHVATDRDVDITKPESITRFFGSLGAEQPEWIINCAAYTAVDLAEDERDAAFAVNAEGPLNLAYAAQRTGAVLVHISTDYVFSGEKGADYEEDDESAPVNTYGKSKLEGEMAVRGVVERHFIIRSAWMYGKNGKNFVSTMLRFFRERQEVRVVCDQTGNPTYAPDLAQILLMIASRRERRYGTYHFTNNGSASWYEFARAIYEDARGCGVLEHDVDILPITSREYPTRARRPQNSCLATGKIKCMLAVPGRGWRDALRDFIGGFS
jgi:dTDP-4-dehydrorhamnose reductase